MLSAARRYPFRSEVRTIGMEAESSANVSPPAHSIPSSLSPRSNRMGEGACERVAGGSRKTIAGMMICRNQ